MLIYIPKSQWATQLSILLGCGFLQLSLSVANSSFLDDGLRPHVSLSIRTNVCGL